MEGQKEAKRRCPYEVLGVPFDADLRTIRAAYKKWALRWHPDKNLDNLDEAKEEFQNLQQAFDVLSDAHERAWYDTHREAILKGGLGKDYQDDSTNLFPYFSASCYRGYGDEEVGFYAVYRKLFDQIYAEDISFDSRDQRDYRAPSFGRSDSSYDEVVHPFYAFWENYCTTKSFVWLHEYDIREAGNRRVSRLMEKENKKITEKAKKKRNGEIRQLVSFIRRRDKRLEKYRKELEAKAAENARKVEANRLRQMEERNREIAKVKEAEWAKMENLEKELKEIESNLATEFGDSPSSDAYDSDDAESRAITQLYCVACNKIFNSEKSFANHESSKKHKEKVAALPDSYRLELDDEKYEDNSDDMRISNSDDEEADSSSLTDAVLPTAEECKTNGVACEKNGDDENVFPTAEECKTNGVACEKNGDDENLTDNAGILMSMKPAKGKCKKKNSKARVKGEATEIADELNSAAKVESPEQCEAGGFTKKSSAKKKRKKKQ
ncbi:dnaJ homolog subfamily C member 21-like [Hetaerina americana]|uniref:dnaJ homolog subfamily C member 21-like n=1 Tax=Hetaerina americana TaxID=62018 RepID=UPI003A7F2E70